MATTSALEAAMNEIDARIMAGPKPIKPVTREDYAAARADLDARARAGQTVQGRNNKGHFTRGVKMFTAGVAPVATAPAKVEKRAEVARPAFVERNRRAPAQAPAFAISAEA